MSNNELKNINTNIKPVKKYDYLIWRLRILTGIFLGYGGLYILREVFSLIIPQIEKEFNLDRVQVSLIPSCFYFFYTLGKFFNGVLSDKVSPRKLLTFAIVSSASVGGLAMSMSNSYFSILAIWGVSGWFQSMGWPPCARLISRWYTLNERGSKWGWASTSHMFGAGTTALLFPIIIQKFGWRAGFIVASIVCFFCAALTYSLIRRSPKSIGLPSPENYKKTKILDTVERSNDDSDNIGYLEALGIVIKNKNIWLLSCAICFLYVVRVGFQTWGPTYLQESKNLSFINAGFLVACFSYTGALGGVIAGYISDKVFKGYRTPVICAYAVLLIIMMIVFMDIVEINVWGAVCFAVVGFSIFGPQVLVSVGSIDYADSRVTSTANGFVGAASSIGSFIAVSGTAIIQDRFGWDSVIKFFILCTIIMFFAVLFLNNPNKSKKANVKN